MIAYRDFAFKRATFLPDADKDRKDFAIVIAEANEWIEGKSIDVLNVETIGLNAYDHLRLFLVWYRTASSKPASHPEV